jgi:hypothetical protein
MQQFYLFSLLIDIYVSYFASITLFVDIDADISRDHILEFYKLSIFYEYFLRKRKDDLSEH